MNPRRPLHTGSVLASALVLDPALLSPRALHARAISLWRPGVRLHALGERLLVLLPEPIRLSACDAPGLPLVSRDGHLTALPAPTPAPPGAVVLSEHGTVRALDLGPPVDPAAWLDLGPLDLLEPRSLGDPPAALAAAVATTDTRAVLSGVPAPDARRQAVIDALRARAASAASAAQPVPSATARAPGPLGRLGAALGATLGRLFRRALVPRAERTAPTTTSRATARALARRPTTPPPPTWLDRLRARAAGLVRRVALRTQLARLIGRKQAEYLAHMARLFEDGQLDDALRHAVPLGELEGGGAAGAFPALSVPIPRTSLELGGARGTAAGGGTLFLSGDGMRYIRGLYRAAFDRLEREGRIDEAAFVLAELLGADEEAVSFLERHGRLRTAAELAEARRLPPGLQVRQWWLAGDRARALELARLHAAFADAATRLARTHRDAAASLRLAWADALADAGDLGAAVEVAHTVPAARALVLRWIELAMAEGGSLAARLLPRRLQLEPEALPALTPMLHALLDDPSLEATDARAALARAVRRSPPSPPIRAVARAVLRATLRDAGRALPTLSPAELGELVELTEDGALRTDLPALSSLQAPSSDRTLEVSRSPLDGGPTPVFDAALLPDGRLALALGEPGLRLISRDGRPALEVDVPAHSLALADHGGSAVALAPRGRLYRATHVDLRTGKTRLLGDLPLGAFAPDHDGLVWFVAQGRSLCALDLTKGSLHTLWRLDADGPIKAIRRSATSLAVHVDDPCDEVWRFDLPTLQLRDRRDLERVRLGPLVGLGAHGATVQVSAASLWITRRGTHAMLPLPAGGPLVAPVALFADHLALRIREGESVSVSVLRLGEDPARAPAPAVHVRFQGASRVSLRLGEPLVVLSDDRGRVLAADLRTRTLVRDLRT